MKAHRLLFALTALNVVTTPDFTVQPVRKPSGSATSIR